MIEEISTVFKVRAAVFRISDFLDSPRWIRAVTVATGAGLALAVFALVLAAWSVFWVGAGVVILALLVGATSALGKTLNFVERCSRGFLP